MTANGQAGARVLVVAEAILVSSDAAGALCGLSGRSWQRLAAEGAVREPVFLGGKRLWCVDLLREWARAGCPSRDQFEELAASTAASQTPDRRPRGRRGREALITQTNGRSSHGGPTEVRHEPQKVLAGPR